MQFMQPILLIWLITVTAVVISSFRFSRVRPAKYEKQQRRQTEGSAQKSQAALKNKKSQARHTYDSILRSQCPQSLGQTDNH